jgi:Zn finger protein HypA/HybF involved in hydrogenase expression
MHELARVRNVLADVLVKANGRKVKKIAIALTASHADEEEFRELFNAEANGTLAEGAEVEIEFVSNAYTCKKCGNEEEVPFDPIRCTKCGSPDLKTKPDYEIIGLFF